MRLKSLEISGFKSFAKKTTLSFDVPVTAIVGPNGSGKSNVAEAFRFVLGEQSVKSLRGKKGEDLIFGGGKTMARLNRASVKVVLDNSAKKLPIDFDEVTIERSVHRDGLNEYFINGSRVRLKDISELLAHANIGASGHHIISQGEADRILSATPIERREMIEDALGLKIYHYRKRESVKKLEKTRENIKQAESLRREIAPHLNFLRKQVEKLEKGQELKHKLTELCLEYFKREMVYIAFSKSALEAEKKEPEKMLAHLGLELKKAEAVLARAPENATDNTELQKTEHTLGTLRAQKDALTRDLGRIEGELAFIARTSETSEQSSFSYSDVKKMTDDIDVFLHQAQSENDLQKAFAYIKKAQEKIKTFFTHVEKNTYEKELLDLNKKKEGINADIEKLSHDITHALKQAEEARVSIEKNKEGDRSAERSMYEIKAKQNEIIASLSTLRLREEKLAQTEVEFKRELGEAGALLGHAISGYGSYTISETTPESIAAEDRPLQEERRRAIERMKIRLEDAGLGTGEETLREYKETSERDGFLQKEITDLMTASASLDQLIADLDAELRKRFDDGIVKINDHFGSFFTTMFGGGEARLMLVSIKKRGSSDSDDEEDESAVSALSDDDEDEETGIDVHVALPHKKTKGLVMLSGGERALTSIALLFAFSQVNPPPFVILDETDAALDEANSRKYGDMIESLAKHSQLVLITHNRETMSRASVLYGVTMSSEGFSTLLSIKFDEAVKVAK